MIIDIEPYYLDSASLEKERLPGFVQCPHAGPFPSDAGTDRSTRSAPLRALLAPLAIAGSRLIPRSLLHTAWEVAYRPSDDGVWWVDQHGHRWDETDVAEATAAGYLRAAVVDERAGAAVYTTPDGDHLYLVRHPPPAGSRDAGRAGASRESLR